MFPDLHLHGRVAIVTGASSGLGVTFAEVLADAGADLVLTARRTAQLEQTRERILALGRRCLAVTADVSSLEDCTRVVETAVAELGHVDVLVSNAGIGHATPAHRTTPEDLASVLAINLVGVHNMAVAFALHAGPGSSIVNVGSVLGSTVSHLPQAAYSASKAAVHELTRNLAAQWSGRRGIRVNTLAPGFFRTEMTESIIDDPTLVERTVLGRTGDPPELAGALLLLASDAGSYITGSTLTVDGGYSL